MMSSEWRQAKSTPFLLGLIVVLAMLAYSLNRGWDIADESYYLLWTIDPARFPASIHPFGQPLHLAYRALGGSLILLRVFGVALLLGSGWLLGRYLDRYYRAHGVPEKHLGFAIPAALFSLSYYTQWLLTPSYNLLANAGIALIVAGGLGWTTGNAGRRHDTAASLLVGFGGYLTFFGKPTSAALMAIGIAVLLIRDGKRTGARQARMRAIIILLSCLVPLLLTIQATVGISSFVQSLRIGLPVLNFGNSLGHQPVKLLKDVAHYPLFLLTVVALVCTIALHRQGRDTAITWLNRAALAGSLLYFVVMAVHHRHDKVWDAVSAPVMAVAVATLGWAFSRPDATRRLALLAPLAVLAAVPFIASFGTANDSMKQTNMSLFGIALAVVIAGRLTLPSARALLVDAGSAAMTLFLLLWGMASPHNFAASSFQQTVPTCLPFLREPLRLDRLTSDYLTGLHRIADREHLSPDTPIFDLTGGGPATAMALGGDMPFFPWIASGFPNSPTLANAVWASMTPAQRRAAWVIGPVEPTLRSSLATAAILHARNRYRLVGKLPMRMWDDDRVITIWMPRQPPVERSFPVEIRSDKADLSGKPCGTRD